MSSTIKSFALQGVEAVPVDVEIDMLRRLPSVAVVGLPASQTKELAERVRSAVSNSGYDFPRQRVVVNLAPADVRKEGTAFDLPVALGILAHAKEFVTDKLFVFGELSLNGHIRPVRGAIAAGKLAVENDLTVVCSAQQGREAALYGARVIAGETLRDVVEVLWGEREVEYVSEALPEPKESSIDFADVRGQDRAIEEIAYLVAGGFPVLLSGPRGAGKSMLARRISTILPEMRDEEGRMTALIHDAAGLSPGTMQARPFRAPHHTVTRQGLIGDNKGRPGEATLAHNGVLFLDEVREFQRGTLDGLWSVMEHGQADVMMAAGPIKYPAKTIIVAATTGCPCGSDFCTCTDEMRARWAKRHEDFLDRFMRVDVPAIDMSAWKQTKNGPSSASLREIVARAWVNQQANNPGGKLTADLTNEEVRLVWSRLFKGDPMDIDAARMQIAAVYFQDAQGRHTSWTANNDEAAALDLLETVLMGGSFDLSDWGGDLEAVQRWVDSRS